MTIAQSRVEPIENPAFQAESRILAFAEAALLDADERRFVPPTDYFSLLWNAEFHGLNRWRRWAQLDGLTQGSILRACNRDILTEMFHIERMGMSYAGRMIDAAQSLEERMFYCAMASEEARHFSYVATSFSKGKPEEEESMPFIDFLSAMLESAPPMLLIFIVQVILEGWGLEHYRGLLRTCRDVRMRQVLKAIIQDEARHHGCGLLSFSARDADDGALDPALPLLRRFLFLVQSGPQMLLARASEGLGGMEANERIAFIEDLEGPTLAQGKLDILRGLIGKDERARGLIASLSTERAWRPFDAGLCADISLGLSSEPYSGALS